MTRIVVTDGVAQDESVLIAALTSSEPTARIMARGSSSRWVADFGRWINDELNRHKGNHAEVLHAMCALQLQLVSTVAAQVMAKGGDRTFLDCYLELAKSEIPEHMDRTRAAAREIRT